MMSAIALSDDLYDIVSYWASAAGTSINSWMHEAIEREAFRRRCIAHVQCVDEAVVAVYQTGLVQLPAR